MKTLDKFLGGSTGILYGALIVLSGLLPVVLDYLHQASFRTKVFMN